MTLASRPEAMPSRPAPASATRRLSARQWLGLLIVLAGLLLLTSQAWQCLNHPQAAGSIAAPPRR